MPWGQTTSVAGTMRHTTSGSNIIRLDVRYAKYLHCTYCTYTLSVTLPCKKQKSIQTYTDNGVTEAAIVRLWSSKEYTMLNKQIPRDDNFTSNTTSTKSEICNIKLTFSITLKQPDSLQTRWMITCTFPNCELRLQDQLHFTCIYTIHERSTSQDFIKTNLFQYVALQIKLLF